MSELKEGEWSLRSGRKVSYELTTGMDQISLEIRSNNGHPTYIKYDGEGVRLIMNIRRGQCNVEYQEDREDPELYLTWTLDDVPFDLEQQIDMVGRIEAIQESRGDLPDWADELFHQVVIAIYALD